MLQKASLSFRYKFSLLILFWGLIIAWPVSAQEEFSACFAPGERVTYHIQYNWHSLWVSAGEVTFSVDSSRFENKPVFHFTGNGKTYRKWDWFYKVRDLYEAYADRSSLVPYKFERDVREGGTSYEDEIHFDQESLMAYSAYKEKGKTARKDTVNLPSNRTLDALTMIYYARCLDFAQYQPGDQIPLSIVLDGKVFDSYVRYFGDETVEVDDIGTIECIKFKVNLIEGSLFKGGEDMTVWVSKDQNQLPIKIDSEILVGSIKVSVLYMHGLKHPLTALKKED